MKLEDGLIKIRTYKEDDTNFILNSWLKSFRNAPFSQNIAAHLYFEVQKRIIQHCLERHDIRVICVADDEYHIVGYCSFNENDAGVVNVDYLYIKSPYRRFGLAKELIKDIRSKFPVGTDLRTDAVTTMSVKLAAKLGLTLDHMAFSERFYVFKMDKAG